MARINIHESWWSDPRRSKLMISLGKESMADGVAVSAWRLSQQYWKNEKRKIPRRIFMTLDGANELIASGLAIDEGDFIYVRGSKTHHEWLIDSQENGKKGGKVGGRGRVKDASRNHEGKFIPNQREFEGTRTNSSSSSSSSPSCSNSASDNLFASSRKNETDSSQSACARFRGAISDFEMLSVEDKKLLENVTHDIQKAWIQTYPDVDWVIQEIKRARVWIVSNPQKAPKVFGRFMSNWLSRSFETYRKGLPSRRQTASEVNMNAIGEMYKKISIEDAS